MLRKILSDQYIIQKGFKLDLGDDGDFIMEGKDVFIDESGNFFKVNGKYFPLTGEAREAEATVFLDEPVDAEKTTADEIMSAGWDSLTIE